MTTTALASELPIDRAMELTLFATPVSCGETSATIRAGRAAKARLTAPLTSSEPTISSQLALCITAIRAKPPAPRAAADSSTALPPARVTARPPSGASSTPNSAPGSR